ncbi:hypothetical protein P7C73_g3438, partial [Tremellales sp. Uapishka_1]
MSHATSHSFSSPMTAIHRHSHTSRPHTQLRSPLAPKRALLYDYTYIASPLSKSPTSPTSLYEYDAELYSPSIHHIYHSPSNPFSASRPRTKKVHFQLPASRVHGYESNLYDYLVFSVFWIAVIVFVSALAGYGYEDRLTIDTSPPVFSPVVEGRGPLQGIWESERVGGRL